MYIKRYLENEILNINRTFKVLYLGGPRQVGKTTLLRHLAKGLHFNYITLDDIAIRQQAKADPKLFIEDHSLPLFIDEIQYAPELLPYIKIKVDQSDRKGQYWITGSQQFQVMKNLQETLVGRVGIVHLLGFSLSEVSKFGKRREPFYPQKRRKQLDLKKEDVFKRMLRGFYPALFHKNSPKRNLFYSSYLQTYIDRDLREIYGINKVQQFHRFVQLCAGRTATVLNYVDLARDAGISVNAAHEWIDILQSTLVVQLLQPYYPNISKRLIKSPKLYFLDTGFAAYLTKWSTSETLRSGAMAGAFFESFIVSEIIKSYLYRGVEPPIYYFKDKEGHEVDVIIERGQKLYPVEIKLASQIKETHIKNITYISGRNKRISTGAVVCLSPERYRLSADIEVLPYQYIN